MQLRTLILILCFTISQAANSTIPKPELALTIPDNESVGGGGLSGGALLAVRSARTFLEAQNIDLSVALTPIADSVAPSFKAANYAEVQRLSDVAGAVYSLLSPLRYDPAFQGAHPAVKTMVGQTIQVCLALVNNKTTGIASPARAAIAAMTQVLNATKDKSQFKSNSALVLAYLLLREVEGHLAV